MLDEENNQSVSRVNQESKLGLFRTKMTRSALAILVVVSCSFVSGWLGAKTFTNGSGSLSTNTQNAKKVVNQESQLISSIAKEVGPSVVSVNVTSQSARRDLLTGQNMQQASAGTGLILSKDGYIITNRHVISSTTTNVNIVLSDGTQFSDVEVVGRTNESDPLDVAFLKIKDTKGKKLTPARLGDSDDMQVGDMVVAIGNALGQFQNTVTSGIISGFGRSVEAQGGDTGPESLQNLFQTDAAINQGNSGGPLVNSDGEVIGINTAIAGDAQNIGFAIPINDARGLINSLLEKGELQRPYLGVSYIQLTPGVAEELKLGHDEGAYIPESSSRQASVLPGSPAEKAGLKEGDIIISINNKNITQSNSLASAVSRFSVGDKVDITYIRDGKEATVKTTITELPK